MTDQSAPQASIHAIASDPCWLPDRYDPAHDAVHFRRVDRDTHRKATFLTPEYLGEEANPLAIRRTDALASVERSAPVHFIFHSAYCCSTLLARAFDMPGFAMGLKEPLILNDMVGWRHRGGEPRRVGEVLDSAITLLSRPFGKDEAIIIKPSNLCNGLAEAMMALRPAAKALLLHAPLPIFLASVARKGMWGRLWVRELMVKQLRDGFIDLGLEGDDYLGLTDLQAAAVGWLAQQALFTRMAARLGPQRIATLDSEQLLAAPADTMKALARHFGVDIDDMGLAEVVSGPAFRQHSKYGNAFDNEARVAEQRDGAQVHREEIEKVTGWADVVAANNQIPMRLPSSLI
jgi:hypothetical protein